MGNAIGASPILSLSSNLKFTKIYDYSESHNAHSSNTKYITPELSNDITLTSSPYIALITHFTSMTIYTIGGRPGYVIIQSGAFNATTADLCRVSHNITSSASIDVPYKALTFQFSKSFFDMAMNGLLYWPDFSYAITANYAGIGFTAEVLAVSLS